MCVGPYVSMHVVCVQVEALRRALQDAERQRAERERQRATSRVAQLEGELRALRSEHVGDAHCAITWAAA